MNSFFRVGMPPDTERLLTPETLAGTARRGGRVELAEAVRDELEGTWALAMLLAARVSICAIACVCDGFGWRSRCVGWLAVSGYALSSSLWIALWVLLSSLWRCYCIVSGGVCCSLVPRFT